VVQAAAVHAAAAAAAAADCGAAEGGQQPLLRRTESGTAPELASQIGRLTSTGSVVAVDMPHGVGSQFVVLGGSAGVSGSNGFTGVKVHVYL
jgi:hypothetical protein